MVCLKKSTSIVSMCKLLSKLPLSRLLYIASVVHRGYDNPLQQHRGQHRLLPQQHSSGSARRWTKSDPPQEPFEGRLWSDCSKIAATWGSTSAATRRLHVQQSVPDLLEKCTRYVNHHLPTLDFGVVQPKHVCNAPSPTSSAGTEPVSEWRADRLIGEGARGQGSPTSSTGYHLQNIQQSRTSIYATAIVLCYGVHVFVSPSSHTRISRTASTKLLIFVVDTRTFMLRTTAASTSRCPTAAVLPPLNPTTRVAECG